jgi:hypothetical protein
MPIIVQEGEALLSLTSAVQAPDENLRTTSINSLAGPVKVFYRDFEVVRIEAREGSLELLPSAVGAITWLRKDRRYQLRLGEQ